MDSSFSRRQRRKAARALRVGDYVQVNFSATTSAVGRVVAGRFWGKQVQLVQNPTVILSLGELNRYDWSMYIRATRP